jgi:hypothetical protein
MSLSSRRAVLRAALATISLSLIATRRMPPARAQARPRLLVFVPAEIPSLYLQNLLRGAINAEITVFGRFRDFETGLGTKPDAVLTLQPVLQAKGLPSTVLGTNAGSPSEAYALIASGKQVTPDKVSSVGAVDLLGRQGMKDLVARVLGAAARVERVTKLEDLLPLLQFGSVEAVLLPERLVEPFRARSKLDLRSSQVPGRVGLPALSVLSSAGASLVESVKALTPAISQQMGVQKWQ